MWDNDVQTFSCTLFHLYVEWSWKPKKPLSFLRHTPSKPKMGGLLRPAKCPGIGSWYCWSIKEKTSHLLLLCFPAVVRKSCSCVICGFIPVLPVAHVYENRPARWHILEQWAGVIESDYEIFFFLRFWFLHKAKEGNRYQLTCKTFPALTFFSWQRSAALGAACDYDFVSIVHCTAQPNKENLGMCFFF